MLPPGLPLSVLTRVIGDAGSRSSLLVAGPDAKAVKLTISKRLQTFFFSEYSYCQGIASTKSTSRSEESSAKDDVSGQSAGAVLLN